MFVRVRGAGDADPLHEFDIPERDYENRPHLFVKVDAPLSRVARPPKFVVKPKKAKFVKKPGEQLEAPAGERLLKESE